MNEQAKIDEIIRLGRLFSTTAADLAGAAFQESFLSNHGRKEDAELMLSNFKHSYAKACFDAYTTGAVEAIRVAEGDPNVPVPWMAEVDVEAEARKLLEKAFFYNV